MVNSFKFFQISSKDSDICLDTSTPLPSKVSTLGDRSGQMSGKSEEIKPTAQLSQATFDSTQGNFYCYFFLLE